MRTRSLVMALLLSSSALTLGCSDDLPAAASPTSQMAPVTTVVLDAGAPALPTTVTATLVDAGAVTAAADPPDAAASGPDFSSCVTATDCVAVPKNDCCHNGFKEAVNKSSVDAYRAAGPKCNPRQKCPMFRIFDKRVPDCSAGKCVLVQPDAGP